jgi:hypothetical protein
VRIELLTVPDCPSRGVALERLRTALALVGLDDTPTIERVVDDSRDAVTSGMRGSPTVLVDGRDLFESDDYKEGSVSCRLYATSDGLANSPTTDQIVEALGTRATGRT